MIRYLSVCSGIEAATVAWEPLGWEPAAFSEIEPFPRAVLKHHYPDVALHGDFTTIEANQYGPIDLLVGGTPCQSFSIAGLRKGLGDDRGNLALEFLRLAQRKRPRWVLWENVPGVFSSLSHDAPDSCPPDIDLDGPDVPEDGEEIVVEDEYDADENHAFSCFLAGLSELGYGLAWRVLDAQYVRVDGFARAVPQRRRRVFVVGYLGDWRRAAAVLLERESLRRDSPPCRKPGQGFAADVVSSLTASGRGVERAGETRGQDPVVAVHAPIVSPALKARDSKGPSSDGDGDGDGDGAPLVAHSLRAEGFDASEDGTERGTPIVPVQGYSTSGVGYWRDGVGPLRAREQESHEHLVAGTICKDSFSGGAGGRPEGAAANHFIPVAQKTNEGMADWRCPSCGEGNAADWYPTCEWCNWEDKTDQTIAFDCKASGRNGFAVGEVAPTLRAMGSRTNHQNAGGQVAVAYDLRGREGGALPEGPHDTANIRASSGGSSRSYVQTEMAVRRLTPRECERLQGFPDDFTLIPTGPRKKLEADYLAYLRATYPDLDEETARRLAADGPRYKALGNSMAVNVMRWIGERIQIVEEITTTNRT